MPRAVSRLVSLLSAALLCSLLAGCARPLEVLYFYSPICPACEESRKSLEQASSLAYLSRKDRRLHVQTYDVVHSDEASDALFAAIDKYRVPRDRQMLPLLIVGGAIYSGLEEVEATIRELSSGNRRVGDPSSR